MEPVGKEIQYADMRLVYIIVTIVCATVILPRLLLISHENQIKNTYEPIPFVASVDRIDEAVLTSLLGSEYKSLSAMVISDPPTADQSGAYLKQQLIDSGIQVQTLLVADIKNRHNSYKTNSNGYLYTAQHHIDTQQCASAQVIFYVAGHEQPYAAYRTLVDIMCMCDILRIPLVLCDVPSHYALVDGVYAQYHSADGFRTSLFPLSPGCTVGELAQYINAYMLLNPIELHIVPMNGYRRTDHTTCGTAYMVVEMLNMLEPCTVHIKSEKQHALITLQDRIAESYHVWHGVQQVFARNNLYAQVINQSESDAHVAWALQVNLKQDTSEGWYSVLLDVASVLTESGIMLRIKKAVSPLLACAPLESYLAGNHDHMDPLHNVRMTRTEFAQKMRHCVLYGPLCTATR